MSCVGNKMCDYAFNGGRAVDSSSAWKPSYGEEGIENLT